MSLPANGSDGRAWNAAASVGGGALRVLRGAGSVPAGAIGLLERIAADLATTARATVAMHEEVRALRSDVQALDDRMAAMAESLESVDALASRFRRRPRG